MPPLRLPRGRGEPTDACQFFYECEGCRVLLRPKKGDCCVFCSYGSLRARPSNLRVRVTVAAAATNFLNSLLEVQRRGSETNPRAFGSQRAKHAPWLLLNGLCLFALSRYEPPHRGEIRVFSFALWILFLFRDLRALGRALPAFFCQLLTHLNHSAPSFPPKICALRYG